MSRPKPSPVVLSPTQQIATLRARAANFRNMALLSKNPGAKALLLQRAKEWEDQADAAALELAQQAAP